MKDLRVRILKEFARRKRLTSTELMEKFGVSRPAIHRHLGSLIREGTILKQGSSRMKTYYILNTPEALRALAGAPKRIRKRIRAQGASEDRLLKEIKARTGLLQGLSEDALANLQYAFTEMVNNAIDHSGSKFIDIELAVDSRACSFAVRDSGVGAFANVMKKKGLASEMEAIEDILKGKQTTMPERHSGQGIFFTSKIVERFVLESHKKRLIVDNRIDDIFLEDMRSLKGTRVTCEIDAHTARRLAELFREYTSEEFAFDRTKVTVKLFESGESYVSRSQAKRLLHSLEQFREIVLDFTGVESVGQAFADEVFRVFAEDHPEMKIEPINMGENVEFMVRRSAPR